MTSISTPRVRHDTPDGEPAEVALAFSSGGAAFRVSVLGPLEG